MNTQDQPNDVRAPFRISVLTQPARIDGELPQEQISGLLTYLVAAANAGVPDEVRLRMAMTRVRKALGGRYVKGRQSRHVLRVPALWVDVWTLFDTVRQRDVTSLSAAQAFHLLEPLGEITDDLTADQQLLDSFEAEVEEAQRELFDLLVQQRPELIGGSLHLIAERHRQRSDIDERVLRASALGLAASGRLRQAIDQIEAARVAYQKDGLPLTHRTLNVLWEHLDGRSGVQIPLAADADPADLPPALADQFARPFAGQRAHIDRGVEALARMGRNVRTILVSGESGIGKSRTCAELALAALQRGYAVRLVQPGSAVARSAAAPFTAIFPALAGHVERILASDDVVESKRARVMIALAGSLEAEAAGRPLLLVVDDVQWLDEYSLHALQQLMLGVTDFKLVLLVSGRDDDDSAWPTLSDHARRAGAIDIAVAPLDRAALVQLVRVQRPEIGAQTAAAIADELLTVSRGLPLIASLLLEGLDHDGVELPTSRALAPGAVLTTVFAALSKDARRVALFASIMGPEIVLEDLSATCGLSARRLLAASDELVDRRWLIRRSPASFVVAHALVQAASINGHSPLQVRRAHAIAAEHRADDLHRRAVHEAESASDAATLHTATLSMLESARQLLANELYREAAVRFARATTMRRGGTLEPEDAGLHARALDLCGAAAAAARVRQAAFDQAIAERRMADALTIATSGLPEAERVDGDPDLVANLERVVPSGLTRKGRWILAQHLARQLTIVGRLDAARSAAVRARTLARSPIERVASAVGERFAVPATSQPEARVAALAGAAADVARLAPEQQAQYFVLLAIDQYEAGDHAEARATVQRLRNMGTTLTPLRRWHSMLFQATLLTDAGRLAEAREFRQEAARYGMACGFAEHENAHAAAEFMDLWVRRQTAPLRSFVGSGPFDPTNSMLARAAVAAVHAEVGELEEAAHHAEIVAEAVIASPVAQFLAALVIAGDALAHSQREDLVDGARDLLRARGDSMVMIGAAVTSLGPVTRCVAALASDRDEQAQALRSAVALADRSRSPLWRVACRRDLLAAGLGDATVAADLRSIAAEAGLTDMT